MKGWWDNAWMSQGLRRGEALVLAAAVLILSVVVGSDGVRGAVNAVGDSLGSTQLFAGSAGGCVDHLTNPIDTSKFKWGHLSFRVIANTSGKTDGSFTMGPDVTIEPVVSPGINSVDYPNFHSFQSCNVLMDPSTNKSLEMSLATPIYTLHKGDVFVACLNFQRPLAFASPDWTIPNATSKTKPVVTVTAGDAVAGAYVGTPSPLPSWGALVGDARCGTASASRMILWAYGRGLSAPVFPQDVTIKIEFGSWYWQ